MTESKNYFDKNGNYINVENLSLAEIYHRAFASGVESVAVRPKGKWRALNFHTCYCTNCHFDFDIMKCDFMEKMKFCPNCGADMRGGAE